MTKTVTSDKKNLTQNEDLKTRKKLAKQEAKLMLRMEQAKKDVQKAEQKSQKAQDVLDIQKKHLQDIEGELSLLQKPEEKTAKSVKPGKKNKSKKAKQLTEAAHGQNLDPGELYDQEEALIALHESSLEPAEGRTDIGDINERKSEQPLTTKTKHEKKSNHSGKQSVETTETYQESLLPVEDHEATEVKETSTSTEQISVEPVATTESAESHAALSAMHPAAEITSSENNDLAQHEEEVKPSTTAPSRRTSRRRHSHTSATQLEESQHAHENQEDNQKTKQHEKK